MIDEIKIRHYSLKTLKSYRSWICKLNRIAQLYEMDMADDYDGAFMFDRSNIKYPNAAKAFIRQWFFPAKSLTFVKQDNEYRRYHLHETHVQRAIKKAVTKARITKRASVHTLRHSYAGHLLEANFDIARFKSS